MKRIKNHFNYLKRFNYFAFFKQKTYQYFEPLLKLYRYFKKSKNNNYIMNTTENHHIVTNVIIGDSQTTFPIISPELVRRIKSTRHEAKCSLHNDMYNSTNTSFLSLVGQEQVIDRMRAVT